jgi:methylated-DNA-[protein]-cysteine S-methyltransferase
MSRTKIVKGKDPMRAVDALYATGPDAPSIAAAQSRLRAALCAHAPQVYYDLLPRSPLGAVYLAAGPDGLLAVGLATDEPGFVRRVARRTGATPVRSTERLRHARQQVDEYLRGKRTALEIDVDLSRVTPFQRAVLEAARRIPRGTVITYGEMAARLRRPRAGRAVGQALAHNPVPILVPCHRVVSAGGELRGYLGDRVGLKARLLKLEGVPMLGDRCRIGGRSGAER